MSWKRNRAQFVAPSAGVLLAAWTALAATPIYEPKDADVASEAVTCRRVGKDVRRDRHQTGDRSVLELRAHQRPSTFR